MVVQLQGSIFGCSNCAAVGCNRSCVFREVIDIIIDGVGEYAGLAVFLIGQMLTSNACYKGCSVLFGRIYRSRRYGLMVRTALTGRLVIDNTCCLLSNRGCCQAFGYLHGAVQVIFCTTNCTSVEQLACQCIQCFVNLILIRRIYAGVIRQHGNLAAALSALDSKVTAVYFSRIAAVVLVNDCCVTAVAADGYASCSVSHINYAVSSIEALQAAGATVVPGAAVQCKRKVCTCACSVPDAAVSQCCTACSISIAIPLAVVGSNCYICTAVVTAPAAVSQIYCCVAASVCAVPACAIAQSDIGIRTAVSSCPSCFICFHSYAVCSIAFAPACAVGQSYICICTAVHTAPARSIQLNRAACSTAVAGPSCAVSQRCVQLAGISSVPAALAQAHGSVSAVVTSPACAFLEVQLYAAVGICCHIAVQLAEVLSCNLRTLAISSNIAADSCICGINSYYCICSNRTYRAANCRACSSADAYAAVRAAGAHCTVDFRSLRCLNIYDIICAYVTVQRCVNCSDIHLAVVSVNCFRTTYCQAACILNCQCSSGCCDTVTAVGSNSHIVVVQLQGCILSCSNCTAVGSNRGCVFREVIDIVIYCVGEYAGLTVFLIGQMLAGNACYKGCSVLFCRIYRSRRYSLVVRTALTGCLVVDNACSLFSNRSCCQAFGYFHGAVQVIFCTTNCTSVEQLACQCIQCFVNLILIRRIYAGVIRQHGNLAAALSALDSKVTAVYFSRIAAVVLVNDCCVTAVAADGYASCSVSHINYAVSSIEALQAAGATVVPGAAVQCKRKVCTCACSVPDAAVSQCCTACSISIAIPLAVVGSNCYICTAVVTAPAAVSQIYCCVAASVCAVPACAIAQSDIGIRTAVSSCPSCFICFHSYAVCSIAFAPACAVGQSYICICTAVHTAPARSIQLNRAACSTAVAGPSCAVSQRCVQLAGISSVPAALAQAHGSVACIVTSPACAFLEVQLYAAVSICCHIAVQLAEVLGCNLRTLAISSNVAADDGISRINRYCRICAVSIYCTCNSRSFAAINTYAAVCTISAHCTVDLRSLRCLNIYDIICAYVTVQRCIHCSDLYLAIIGIDCFRTTYCQAACILNCQRTAGCCDTIAAVGSNSHIVVVQLQSCVFRCGNCATVGRNSCGIFREVIDIVSIREYTRIPIFLVCYIITGYSCFKICLRLYIRNACPIINGCFIKTALTCFTIVTNITGKFSY